MIELTNIGKQLLFAGIVLFLLGLIQGTLIPYAKNSRMALSGHLTAVQCGMALMIFGIIWSLIQLSPFMEKVAAYGSIVGYILIWVGISTASLTGASKALPIAGAGYSTNALVERAVIVIEAVGVLCSLIAGGLLVLGLFPIVFD